MTNSSLLGDTGNLEPDYHLAASKYSELQMELREARYMMSDLPRSKT
jgi:hypothetical protein